MITLDKGKKKILFCITLPDIGGAQKVVYDIISYLDTDSFDITLATSAEGPLTTRIRELNDKRANSVRIVIIPSIKREISLLNDIHALYCLYRLIKAERFDIVHLHSSKAGFLGRCAARLAGVPKVFYTVHGWGIYESDSRIKQFICGLAEKTSCRICTKVICVSHHDYDKGISRKWIRGDNTCVIHNGIEEAHCRHIGDSIENLPKRKVLVIGTVMRLQEPKDPFFTIKVFREVKMLFNYPVKLVIVGKGRLMEDCRKLIGQLGLDIDVQMMGECEPAMNIISSFDIFTLFSRSEGLPISIIEAMSAGKPIVASNVGGIPELVRDNYNGFLVKGTDITKAALSITMLLKDAGLRAKMGLQSMELAHTLFSRDRMTAAYEKLYLF